LKQRKLSLVVDLDQTIIHATVDPTVAEWQEDEENPNHRAVKDVKAFQLVDEGPGGRGCWYYIKLRPGLMQFLESISELYELHIYTMGTRAYAQSIAAIIDPDRKIFGDRILSRDESGSLVAKNLQRLFPVDTKMVVIIDDRGDVWKWSDNLIKVNPYDFFVGIGDINSSFLPKKQELKKSVKGKAVSEHKPDLDLSDATSGEELLLNSGKDITDIPATELGGGDTEPAPTQVSALEQLVSMGGGDDPEVLQAQASKQDEALAAQLQDRPLLQKQKALDAEDEAAAAAAENAANDGIDDTHKSDDSSSHSSVPRHNLLHDDDQELIYLERSLADVHRAFFEEYEKNMTDAQGGRVAQLRGSQSKKLHVKDDGADLQVVPDIKVVMPRMKMQVLEGVVLVLSGVIPLGLDVLSSDIAHWARSFGAVLVEKVTKHTTHVVAARNRTQKVRQAAKRPDIKIVTTQWLFDSLSQWHKLNEKPYEIRVHPEDRKAPLSSQGGNEATSFEGNTDEPIVLSETEDETGMSDDDQTDLDEAAFIEEEFSGERSPIDGTFDWDAANEELKEFLDSDGEGETTDGDSDAESIISDASRSSQLERERERERELKRKRSASPSQSENGDMDRGLNGEERASGDLGSKTQKRIKRALGRSSSLKNVSTLVDSDSSLPTPDNTGGEEGEGVEGDPMIEDGGDYDSDFELERELEKEMEAQLEEDERVSGATIMESEVG
jgi:RNA polymerase II subunit A-like phosphatase